jgi:hypothetical protein
LLDISGKDSHLFSLSLKKKKNRTEEFREQINAGL